ncbi:MAG: hypothetical protein AABW91_01295, partial [Nanoarchaeota archaeon]
MKENKQIGVKKTSLLFSVIILSLFLIFSLSISFVYAQSSTNTSSQSQVSYCCERTKTGAYCQNAPLSECDSSLRSTPTSCEATSFCQKGTCYDSDEGLCMENVPEEACKQENGLWSLGTPDSIPQCSLGCCLVGQQAAYTTLQRCKKMSADFGLITDWKPDVQDEVACIGLATAQDLGACVYESEYVTTCKFGTKGECDSSKLKGITNSSQVGFYKDYLCTNPEFVTDCQPTTQTICLEDKQGVYFVDSCGNTANLYDASKINDQAYWTKVVPKEEACSADGNNANSRSCGNCNYLDGSFCGKADGTSAKPNYGDYICKDINCKKTSDEKSHKNGESWCFWDSGKEDSDAPGSRAFRHICFMGEETVEPCADYRQETCVQDSIDGFSQAGCVVNRWQDCILQNSSKDCLNIDKRDCQWTPLLTDKADKKNVVKPGMLGSINSQLGGLLGGLVGGGSKEEKENKDGNWRCTPKIAPGLQFWDTSSSSQCNLASQSCLVKYEKGLLASKRKCVEHCECIEENAKFQFNLMCTNYGDCGADKNY